MEKCTTYTIGKTVIAKEYDEYGYEYSDVYGKFTNDIGPGVYIRSEDEFYERLPVEMERDYDGRFYAKGTPEYRTYDREYNGIIPANSPLTWKKDWSHVPRKTKSEVIKKYGSLKNASYAYALEDCRRLESLNNGHWSYIIIRVETRIATDTGLHDMVYNTLSGVESDGGKDHMDEIIQDLKSQNKAELLKMGFSEEEINQSLNSAEERD